MNQRNLFAATVAFALTCSIALAQQDHGAWRAVSKTAQNITGDIAVSAERISINFVAFPMALIRPVRPAEVKAVFNLDAEPAANGDLYKLSIPGSQKFLRKNSLCGADDVQWMLTYTIGKELGVAFFSGSKMPDLTPEAMATTTDLCGTFTYAR